MKGIVDNIEMFFFLMLGVLGASPTFSQVIAIHNENYDVLYNASTGIPERVEWMILPQNLGSISRTAAGSFRQDKRLSKPRPKPSQYNGTGYHRGHMCAAADFSGDVQFMRSTFLMSNICPMVPIVNTGSWKATEERCRWLARKFGGVRVVAWSYILDEDTTYLPRGHIAIPSHFGKQVFTIPGDSLLGEWFIPNSN